MFAKKFNANDEYLLTHVIRHLLKLNEGRLTLLDSIDHPNQLLVSPKELDKTPGSYGGIAYDTLSNRENLNRVPKFLSPYDIDGLKVYVYHSGFGWSNHSILRFQISKFVDEYYHDERSRLLANLKMPLSVKLLSWLKNWGV